MAYFAHTVAGLYLLRRLCSEQPPECVHQDLFLNRFLEKASAPWARAFASSPKLVGRTGSGMSISYEMGALSETLLHGCHLPPMNKLGKV